MPRYIILDDNNIVISVREGTEIVENEIESTLGELGQKRLEDGNFISLPIEPQPHIPSNTEIAQMISDLQADLIIAGVI